jgi:hypothetical protein
MDQQPSPKEKRKFTPEQCMRLGQVHAMILPWNCEDCLCQPQDVIQTSTVVQLCEDHPASAKSFPREV